MEVKSEITPSGYWPGRDGDRLVPLLLVGAIARDTLGDSKEVGGTFERPLGLAWSKDNLPPVLLFAMPARFYPGLSFGSHLGSVTEISDSRIEAQASIGDPWLVPEQLSESETRVLRYLPSNLSAPEIARELYVSINTVKTHLRHLYAKLGVHRRREAVDRARRLGLLGSPSAA